MLVKGLHTLCRLTGSVMHVYLPYSPAARELPRYLQVGERGSGNMGALSGGLFLLALIWTLRGRVAPVNAGSMWG